MTTEHFIIGSDNVITLTLTEDADPIAGAWTGLDVDICDINTDALVLNLNRAANGTGIAFTAGVLTITPGELPELSTGSPLGAGVGALVKGQLYRAYVTVETASQTDGVDFGRGDTVNKLYFLVDERSA